MSDTRRRTTIPRRRRKGPPSSALSSTQTTSPSTTRISKSNNPNQHEASNDKNPMETLIGGNTPDFERSTTTAPTILLDWRGVIFRHVLFWILLVAGLPYGSWVGYRWMVLQHPLLYGMRPAVTMGQHQQWSPAAPASSSRLQDDTVVLPQRRTDHPDDWSATRRQVLILGSMSSGTSSIAAQLSDFLFEVGHEDSDTEWKFVRDGTVSWFHAIRYWDHWDDESTRDTPKRKRNHTKVMQNLCLVQWYYFSKRLDNYGWGPTLFGTPSYNCSVWNVHSNCFQQACRAMLQNEYACASSSSSSSSSCQPAFVQTLVQFREPWKIVSSLVAKYCWNDEYKGKDDDGILPFLKDKPPLTFTALMDALEVRKQRASHYHDHDERTTNTNECVMQMVDYIYGYYDRLLTHPALSDYYRIETTSTCEVARLALFDQPDKVVWQPNYQRYQQHCGSNDERAVEPKKKNTINKGRVQGTDLLPFVTMDHVDEMEDLYQRMGYAYPAALQQRQANTE